ncbi:extracellular solute-binding protein [Lignipirellula cremea]|uniref:Bacterial extracellular solute-binding protein n=1 Tax=Lignipirellula cremea TaxID=2528010 RepID=A0A518DW56_9BACT|nr:extracellular solute-binding protein [Lignipirellula cremea]QDU96070.1 Bacterial extracellular solute-binding protein [Lignipirellula cremea]
MWKKILLPAAGLTFVLAVFIGASFQPQDEFATPPPDREVVTFWHFWGGADRDVVENVVRRFNASQDRYYVQPLAMPGNNLDVKLFLSVTGGAPPDLVNQDDPILADWASRGAITPLDEVATPAEMASLTTFLFPAARRLTTDAEGRMYGLCNGLDIRALYYNQTLLDELNLAPPRTLAELDALSINASAFDDQGRRTRIGYLPDSRRLWAWGAVFGGDFYNEQAQRPTADSPPIVAALGWMQGYAKRLGAEEVQRFRAGDQSLPGKAFPLLPQNESPGSGRYAMILDGQWRTRDIAASNAGRVARGLAPIAYGVAPLPPPPGGPIDAGWVNGNFFLIPRSSRHPQGAWEFMKFWTGLGDHAAAAAETAAAGGWIPVSQQVVDQPRFAEFLQQQPLFQEFIRLAASPNQQPVPVIPGAALYDREIKTAGAAAMSQPETSPAKLLQVVDRQVERHLQFVRSKAGVDQATGDN